MSAAEAVASHGLFRPEALEAQRRAALGRIQVNTPLAHWAISGFVIAFIGALLVFLCLGHYTRRDTVAGSLVPSAGLLTLSAASVGRVMRVDVREGQHVARGQVLAEFDNPLDSAALGNTQAFITAQLQRECTGLRQDLTTQQALAASQAETLIVFTN
jgi:membrane fusion protein